MIDAIGDFKSRVAVCEEECITACLENRGERTGLSDNLSPTSKSTLLPRSVSVDDTVCQDEIETLM